MLCVHMLQLFMHRPVFQLNYGYDEYRIMTYAELHIVHWEICWILNLKTGNMAACKLSSYLKNFLHSETICTLVIVFSDE
jgi:hypothetical protein